MVERRRDGGRGARAGAGRAPRRPSRATWRRSTGAPPRRWSVAPRGCASGYRRCWASAQIDPARLATEVAVWADETDVSEELARLRAHLAQLAALLAGDEPVGRTLDFLIQEINREVNTVGSKADDLEISQTVIAAKATLEKMREQVQNIE